MTEAKARFDIHLAEGQICLKNYDITGHDFALRYIWIVAISAFELYITELISEAGLRLIDRTPPVLTANLRQVQIPLEKTLQISGLSPTERLLFYQQHIYSDVQFKSFYRPEKLSEALSYIWVCPAKEKWARILAGMISLGRYAGRSEHDIRDELTLIGDRRDLIAHSVDTSPGSTTRNPADRVDATQVLDFIRDLVSAIDQETERQLQE